MLPRIRNTVHIFNSFGENIAACVLPLIILVLVGSPVGAVETSYEDSVLIAEFNSIMADSGLERPNLDLSLPFKSISNYLHIAIIPDNVRVRILCMLGDYLCSVSDFEIAKDHYTQAYEVASENFDTCGIVHTLRCMGVISRHRHDYPGAKSLFSRILLMEDACPDTNIIFTKRSLADVYTILGRYDDADSLYQEVIKALEELGYGSSFELALCLENMAYLYREQLKFHDAEAAYLRSIGIHEQLGGPFSNVVVRPMLGLSGLYIKHGHFHKSDRILSRAFVICDSVLPPDHVFWGGLFAQMGFQSLYQGRYNETEKYLNAAIEIMALDSANMLPNIGTIHIWLAWAKLELNAYEKSVFHCRQSLAAFKLSYGMGHQLAGTAYSNMAKAYLEMGEYARAEIYLDSALSNKVKALGEEHPLYATTLTSKGEFLYATGQYAKSKTAFENAIRLLAIHLDPYHPSTARALLGLSRACCSLKDYQDCRENYRQFLSRRLKFIEYAFSFSSEEQKLRWINTYPVIDNSLISAAMDIRDPAVIRDACEMILKGKGIVIDALATEHTTAYCSYDSSLVAHMNAHRQVSEMIAALSTTGNFQETELYRKDSIAALYDIKDSLETELSRRCSTFSDHLASLRFDMNTITSVLSQEEILVDYVRYVPYDFEKNGNYNERTGEPRYCAFVISNRENIELIDLGPVKRIDSLIHAVLDLIYNTGVEVYSPFGVVLEEQLRQTAGQLHDMIFSSVKVFLTDRKKIYISPDGVLNLLPFEILPFTDSTYVIEHFQIQYLSSGRDLIRFSRSDYHSNPYALFIADPEFDYYVIPDNQRFSPPDSAPRRIMNGDLDNCLKQKFTPIPYTRQEVRDIARKFEGFQRLETEVYYGAEATEDVLKNISAPPRVLHLATHGVFCNGRISDNALPRNNPMLRAGLAFTGANTFRTSSIIDSESSNDGILYALEIAALNLHNTELAVLSACETGSGEILNGEGVLGLRRAFQQSGVQSIVMSLWTVPDQETSKIMSGFYERWLKGATKSEALRESSLEILREQRIRIGNGHPYYWGGFILSSNPN